MPSPDSILEELGAARTDLLRSADGVAPTHWRTSPRAGAWSTGEVIAHLGMVERTVTGTAGRLLEHPPKHVPFFRRLHRPLAFVSLRIFRVKSPLPLDPALLGEKEKMLAELRLTRERTLAFLSVNRDKDLRAYRWPHPFLGSLNFSEWFLLLARHEVRHTKQIREIIESLRK